MTPDADGSPVRAIPVLLLRERSGGADACACRGGRWERQVLARARPTAWSVADSPDMSYLTFSGWWLSIGNTL